MPSPFFMPEDPGSKLDIESNVSLAPFTTLGVGGPARYFFRANNESHLIEALLLAERQSIPVFILGGGSNLLVSDAGFDGLVIQIAMDRSKQRATEIESVRSDSLSGRKTRITAGAGENWDGFVAFCVENGLSGVECLSGIPGSVGGTPVQNVGAYGQEVSETIVSVNCIDRRSLTSMILSNAECGFSYRQSIFNSTETDRYIVCEVTYELQIEGEPKIVYKDLLDYFAAKRPSLSETREAVLAIRRAKSMVIDDKDPNSRSAGSFFKNPVVSEEKYSAIAGSSDSEVPMFQMADGGVKIPAAWLIEQAGFYKGYRMGRAGISANHSLALINLGGAEAKEIIALKDTIQEAVESRFAISLVPEPVFVGF